MKALCQSQISKGVFDPVQVLKQATEQKQLILLESADIVTKLGEKSMLLLDLGLALEARGPTIRAHATLGETESLLSLLEKKFANTTRLSNSEIDLHIKAPRDELDLLKKLAAPSALDILRTVLRSIETSDARSRETLMLSGVFAYDFIDHFEKLPKAREDVLKLPDYLFYLPLTNITIDHTKNLTTVNAYALVNDDEGEAEQRVKQRLIKALDYVDQAMRNTKPRSTPKAITKLDKNTYQSDIGDKDFGVLIERCQEHIKAGDVYQIVPSRTFSQTIKDPIACYEALKYMNPSPYMFYVQAESWTLFGASPETFVKVDKFGSRLSIRPIAGTRRRGLNDQGLIDEELDAREQASLCLDEKELAEHMMLVDLARNDVASVAKPQTRRIKRLLGVDRFSHVMHLVSEITGILQENFDALSAYQASMNMGTLMGAPKVRAAELLRELEKSKRGFYGGAVGYINGLGDMDTSIIIRSALVQDGKAYVRAGCGVVYDSKPAFEIQETVNKAEAVLKAIGEEQTHEHMHHR